MGRLADISLRSRVWLLVALLAGTTAVVPALYLPGVLARQSRVWMERRYLDIARAVAGLAEAPLEFDDEQGAAGALSGLGRTSGAVYARLVRADGSTLASWGAVPAGAPVPRGDGGLDYHGDLLHLRRDVATRGGSRGMLLAGFRLDELAERRREAASVVGRTSTVALAVALAAGFLLVTVLLRPLRRVTDLAARIAGGDGSAAAMLAEMERGDETGRFAASLGKVVASLADKQHLLEAQSEASSDAILTLSEQGAVLFHNRRLPEMAGRGPASAFATWTEVRDALRTRVVRPLPAWLEADRPSLPASAAGAFDLELKDGRHLRGRAAEVRGRGGSRALGLRFRDVTELAQAQSAQVSFEKLGSELLGELEAARARAATLQSELDRARDRLGASERSLEQARLHAGAAQEIRSAVSMIGASLAYVQKGIERVAESLGSPSPATRALAASTASTLSSSLLQAREATQRIAQLVRGLDGPEGAPGASRGPGEAPAVPPVPAPAGAPSARILLVDDEPLVGAAVQRMLGSAYDVTLVVTGAAAVERVRSGERFDLVLCDLRMPDLDGMEVAAQVSRLRPELGRTMLFMSSGMLSEALAAFVERNRPSVLPKPFERAALRRLVEERLSSTPTARSPRSSPEGRP